MQARRDNLNQSIERYAKAKFELERSLKAPNLAQSVDTDAWKHSVGRDVAPYGRSGQQRAPRVDAGAQASPYELYKLQRAAELRQSYQDQLLALYNGRQDAQFGPPGTYTALPNTRYASPKAYQAGRHSSQDPYQRLAGGDFSFANSNRLTPPIYGLQNAAV